MKIKTEIMSCEILDRVIIQKLFCALEKYLYENDCVAELIN